jgi:hypothetical protein
MYEHLDRWVRTGKAPPAAADLVVGNDNGYVRDADGNSLGGLRLPEVEVPVAAYNGFSEPFLDPDCPGIRPFTRARLDELYSSHADYVRKYKKAARRNVADGFVLPYTAKEMIAEAKARPIP